MLREIRIEAGSVHVGRFLVGFHNLSRLAIGMEVFRGMTSRPTFSS